MTDDDKAWALSASWARPLFAFAVLFALYQLSEGLQTRFAPASPLGPALMLATLILAWPLGRWLGAGWAAYGLEWRPWVPRLLLAGLLLATLAKLASLAIAGSFAAGTLTAVPGGLTLGAISLALLTTFVPSLAEDILTRGFLLRAFPLKLGPVAFIAGSALLYTLNHLWRLDWGISEQVRLFCLGLAYGAAAWRWRSLWGAVALHWGWNLANALAGEVLSLDGGSVDAGRYLSALAHLVLLAIVLLLPRRDAAQAEGSPSP